MPIIDVVIPVKNGMPEVRECIEGLRGQSLAFRRIIAIDSGSTDGTDSYLEGLEEVDLIRIRPSEFNHGLTRNIGWQRSDAELLFYTVQDARPGDPRLLERLADGFLDPDVEGVCGRQVVCHNKRNNPVEWHRPIDPPTDRRYRLPDAAAYDACTPESKREMCAWDNVVAMYRRSALERVPFRDATYGEDMLWAADMLRAGSTILYRPSSTVCHYHLQDRVTTIRRALSSLYFRYIHFGYRYPRPETGPRVLARILRYTCLAGEIPIMQRLGWLRYNLVRTKALAEAWKLFEGALDSGTLDELYGRWVEQPHVPLKKY